MSNLLAVAAGGACGAVLRFLVVGLTAFPGLSLPLGTLLVNVLGSLILGVLAGFWMLSVEPAVSVRLFFQTGLLGAFTTFSAFSLDTLTLWQNGQIVSALTNVFLNLLLCLLAVAAGFALATAIQR